MRAQTGGRDGQKQDGKETLQGKRELKKAGFVEEDASLEQAGVRDDSMENFYELCGHRFSTSLFKAAGVPGIICHYWLYLLLLAVCFHCRTCMFGLHSSLKSCDNAAVVCGVVISRPTMAICSQISLHHVRPLDIFTIFKIT